VISTARTAPELSAMRTVRVSRELEDVVA